MQPQVPDLTTDVALIRKLRGPLTCLAYIYVFHECFYNQVLADVDRRLVEELKVCAVVVYCINSSESIYTMFFAVANGFGGFLRFYTLKVSVITKGLQSRADT